MLLFPRFWKMKALYYCRKKSISFTFLRNVFKLLAILFIMKLHAWFNIFNYLYLKEISIFEICTLICRNLPCPQKFLPTRLFTPLVFLIYVGMRRECSSFYKILSKVLTEKRETSQCVFVNCAQTKTSFALLKSYFFTFAWFKKS